MTDAAPSMIAQEVMEKHDVWTDPDLSFLSIKGKRAPALQADIFGIWSDRFRAMAAQASAPVDYVAFGFLAHCAALIGNAARVHPDPEGSPRWTEPVALWAMLVGPPSSGKTPALKPFESLIFQLEKEAREAFEPEQRANDEARKVAAAFEADWEKKVKEAIKNEEEPPARPDNANPPDPVSAPRIRINDATIEKVALLQSSSPKGLLQFRDELAAWLEGMTRYSEASTRAQWLEMYNAGTLTIDRVKYADPIIVERALVSILGGIQPDRLKGIFDSPDDGLLARFVYVWPLPAPLQRATGLDLSQDIENVFRRLDALKASDPLFLFFSPEAADVFFRFRQRTRDRIETLEGIMAGWVGKADGLVARLSGLLCLLDWASEDGSSAPPNRVEAKWVENAISLWEQYLYPMTERTLGEAALPIEERLARQVLAKARAIGAHSVKLREIYRDWSIHGLARKPDECRKVLEVLEEAGWVRSERHATGGRPSQKIQFNPLLFSHTVD